MNDVLGIETSCDETAAAVVAQGRAVRSSIVFSQEDLHRRFGGVVPELASRQHILGIMPSVDQALAGAGATWEQISAVAVSRGPGLAGSLLVGVNVAKAIAFARGVPLVGVNHLEGHIYANWISAGVTPEFPVLCLVVSGGHTELILMEDHGRYRLLGRTRDDAAGEAFDKVARILGLGYPGGPAVERVATGIVPEVIPERFRLPRPWLRGSDDFSFSGLKTAVLRIAQGGAAGPVGNPTRPAGGAPSAGSSPGSPSPPGSPSSGEASVTTIAADRLAGERPAIALSETEAALLAAAFQEAVVDVLVGKTCHAAQVHRVRQIALAGGVAANRRLREVLVAQAPVPVLVPDFKYCTDNAAMIAAAGYFRLRAGDIAGLDLDVSPSLRLA